MTRWWPTDREAHLTGFPIISPGTTLDIPLCALLHDGAETLIGAEGEHPNRDPGTRRRPSHDQQSNRRRQQEPFAGIGVVLHQDSYQRRDKAMTRRSIALLTAALLMIGIMAPAASAVPPDIFTDEWVDEYYIGECDGFSMHAEDNVEATIKFFYNKDGSVDRVHFHFMSDGIVYNSEEPWKTLPSSWNENAITDENFEVWFQSGLYFKVKLPKGGVVLMDAGRFTVDVSSGEPIFDRLAGKHQLLEEDFADICEALS